MYINIQNHRTKVLLSIINLKCVTEIRFPNATIIIDSSSISKRDDSNGVV
jgi:hypothetical protein